MPADPIHPDRLDGEARFRADLAASLDTYGSVSWPACWESCPAAASSR
jgi:hypothetical protein